MRILFISQLFDPENSVKGLEFAKRLTALGHEVEVVTTFPSYPGGRLYSGFRQRLRQVDHVGGITVVRLPTYVSHGASTVRRLLSYASFGAVAAIYGLIRQKRFDVIYAYYPPLVVGWAALLVSRVRRTPFVYDVQDLWPDALVATGYLKPAGMMTRLVEWCCGLVYRTASRIVVLSDGYKRTLADRGVRADKIQRVFNWCDESRISLEKSAPRQLLEGRYFNLLYAGNLGAAQALDHVIEAARLVEKRGNKRVRFVFLGTGVAEEALRQQAENFELENVQFIPRVPVDEVGGYLFAADALLVHLADDPVFEITIPQKTQAYLMAGRPILMAVRGEAGDIVRAACAGMVVEPCQPELLADAAIFLSSLPAEQLSRMSASGKAFYRENMSMESGVLAVERLLQSVASEK